MELFETASYYIIQDTENALWCSRETGFMEARNAYDLCRAENPICLGLINGVIGRIQVGLDPECNWLLLISRQTEVGFLPGMHPIFRIDSVVFLPLVSPSFAVRSQTPASEGASSSIPVYVDQFEQQQSFDADVRDLMASNLQQCPKHTGYVAADPTTGSIPATTTTTATGAPTGSVFKRTFNTSLTSKYRKPDSSRLARRILECLDKLFNDSPSFYYSSTGDITASTWRISAGISHNPGSLIADDRFFWNKNCLSDLISSSTEFSSYWIVPIIQGYVEFERVTLEIESSSLSSEVNFSTVAFENRHNSEKNQGNPNAPSAASVHPSPSTLELYVGVISRRSRHRAGTRYKKRGADELGHCANYVETEQILYWNPHWCSYVILRGSVPLHWSQSGIQYRPPPKLEKTQAENAEVFRFHFDRELCFYREINVVNLLHQSSKEQSLCNAYSEHILYYNSPSLSYITFDFNEHCRGMKFENVLILTQSIDELIRDSCFTWIDDSGRVCEQSSIFRVNCLDCLDRTNIVEAAICRVVLEIQCGKMGILPPDSEMPSHLLKVFKTIWANNGDVISRQYAGTNALKGDYTRTGEHGLAALVKDGVNSANRYYLNQFQDASRQLAIDVSLGVQPTFSERLSTSTSGALGLSPSSQNLAQMLGGGAVQTEQTESIETKCENLLAVMDDVRQMLLTEQDLCLGSWLLFDSSDSSATPDADFDVIMLLSMNSLFIVRLDVEGDPVFYYDLPLSCIEKVESGQLLVPGGSSGGLLNFAKKNKKNGVKISYRPQQQDPLQSGRASANSLPTSGSSSSLDGTLCFLLRPAKFRLFSGVLIPVENNSDAQEVLTMVCECFRNVTRISNLAFQVDELGDIQLKLEKRRVLRIDGHPNKKLWADQTLQPLMFQSAGTIDSRKNSVLLQASEESLTGDIDNIVNAPKKLFVNTFKQFSSLIRPNSSSDKMNLQGALSGSASVPPSPQHMPNPSSASQQQPLTPQHQISNRKNAQDGWKQETVKQMTEYRTRVIQL